MKFLIIGAGLGGLTAAIALRQRGFEVEVFDAATGLTEVGAGLTLAKGAQYVFRALGMQREIAAAACPAGRLPFLHYRDARCLIGAPDPGDGLPDDGEEDIIRHAWRSDVQAVLLRALGQSVKAGHRLVSFEESANKVCAAFSNGAEAEGELLVGADGVRSAVRALLFPADEPRFTNHVAYRFLVPMEEARPFMAQGRSAIFIGPQKTFNRYTISGGATVNCAGLAETGEAVPEGWSIPASKEEVLEAFAGWHPDVTGLIGCATQRIKWGLYDRAPLDSWSRGRVTLLGDAAHAMLPFLGMGAAMAIEDGYILARALEAESDVAAALTRYEAARKPRTELVHAKSIEQGRMTQAIDPDAIDPAAMPLADQAMMGFNPVVAGV